MLMRTERHTETRKVLDYRGFIAGNSAAMAWFSPVVDDQPPITLPASYRGASSARQQLINAV